MQYRGASATIAIVEDDAGLNQAMARLLMTAEFTPVTFTCVEQFLAADVASRIDCLVTVCICPAFPGWSCINGSCRQALRARRYSSLRTTTGISACKPLQPASIWSKPSSARRCCISSTSCWSKLQRHRPWLSCSEHRVGFSTDRCTVILSGASHVTCRPR